MFRQTITQILPKPADFLRRLTQSLVGDDVSLYLHCNEA